MSELAIIQNLQDVIQALAEFDEADVVINDYGVLDQSLSLAPYVIFETSDDFDISNVGPSMLGVWSIPAVLVVKFDGWDNAQNDLLSMRQKIIDAMGGGSAASASTDGLLVRRIYSGSPLQPLYASTMSEEQARAAGPVYLTQRIIFECEEF